MTSVNIFLLPALSQQHLLHAVSQVHRFGQRFSSLRDDFRMFRAERITALAPTGASFRPRRAALLRAYRAVLDAR
jgi:predicted DNA-binding transcriptional regulator YafY